MTRNLGLKVGTPDENVQQLRSMSAGDVMFEDWDLFHSPRLNSPLWRPVRNDGVFFTENAQNKLDEVTRL